MSSFKKNAFIFPGQGSQYPGMGKDFFNKFPVVKETFEEADDVLKFKLSSIVFDGPEALLTETKNSQLGIFVTSIAILRVINQEFPHLMPSMTAGLSLGEYSALVASKLLSFVECLPLVSHRGQYMNDACESKEGTMAVVLGLEAKAVEDFVKELNMPDDLFVANLNCPGQVVVSGTKKGIEEATLFLKAKGAKRVLPLAVHGAFHSGLMKEAKERLKPYIEAVVLKDSSVQLAMNVPGGFVKDPMQIKNYLIDQVTSPVRWEASVLEMKKTGTDFFIEMGPGKTLAAMIKRIDPALSVVSIEKVEDLELLMLKGV